MSKKKIRRPQQYTKKKDRTLKEWYQDQTDKTRKLLQYALIAVLALALLLTVYFVFIYDDGSLDIRKGAVVGAQDNWIITDLSENKKGKYYHLADIDTPEGYAISEESATGTSTSTTDYSATFTYNPVDETSPVKMVYVAGVAKTPADMVESVYSTFQGFAKDTGSVTEITDMITAYGTGKYFAYDYSYADETVADLNHYSKSLVCYLPTQYKNASVLISVLQTPESPDDYLTIDELLAYAQTFMDQLTIADKK